jgi:hypothetical protein
MNPDALSDLVLLLVCAAVLWFHLRQRPAVAMAAGLIGLAACLGVLRYSGWAEMLGPHRFTSLLAACAAFPLLASGLRWPDAPLATRGAAVGRFVLVVGGVGIVLTLAGLALWSQVVPGVCALVIAWTAVQQRNTWGLARRIGISNGLWKARKARISPGWAADACLDGLELAPGPLPCPDSARPDGSPRARWALISGLTLSSPPSSPHAGAAPPAAGARLRSPW